MMTQKKIILVCDDSLDIREFLTDALLVPAGYEVRSVSDGLSALSLTQELKPALVITDHQMPNMTGMELARRIRRDYPEIPVIMITGESTEKLVIEALRAGVNDYFVKPFDPDGLLIAVKQLLGSKQLSPVTQPTATVVISKDDALQSRVRELEALTMIGRNVTAMLDLDDVLSSVVEAAVRLTDAEEGSLLLLDEESGELYMRASKNFDQKFVQTFRLRVHDSLAGQVIASGEPVVIDKTAPQKIKTAYLVHSLVYVPLQVRGHTIGILGVDNRSAGRILSREHVKVLQALSDYAAIAIENAQLYEHSETERQKLETILTEIKSGALVIDQDNRILIVNPTAREILDISADPIGKPVFQVVKNQQILGLLRISGSQPRREEVELSDGRIFHALRTPVIGVGQAVIMQDITHLKELDRIKSEFVTTVSHDLRSPLTAILGYVELIERAGDVNDQQREFIRRVQNSVEQITSLVTDLLDLGRIEAGLDTAKERIPIVVIARHAIESLRAVAEDKSIKLDISMPEITPFVYGDPVRMRQMIGNLIENAVKYTPEQGVISFTMEPEQDQVIMRVNDNGPGIPPSDLPYVFDKFFRASNAPDSLPGTGLGLSIVKSIVESHNGRVWVDSKLGNGTSFSVVLPLDQG